MAEKIHVEPLGRLAHFADVLMIPIMYIASGTFREAPQRTHRWNNTKLDPQEVKHLRDEMKVFCDGVSSEAQARFVFGIPVFHIPIVGGWKEYVVLQPSDVNEKWHVGWIPPDEPGVSRLTVCGPARVLLGPGAVSFFGVDTEGNQIPIHEIARGRIGDNGPYANVPLL